MIEAIRNFHSTRKIARTLYAVVKTSVAVAIAVQAFEVFFVPQAVYAAESNEQRLPKQVNARHQNTFDIKIRKSLDLQKEFGNPASALRVLDNLFDKIEKRVKTKSSYNKKEAVKALKTIGGVLKEEGHFEYRRNNLLIEGLKKQKNGKRFIDCDDYSSIYLIAGERIGLTLEPVYVPKHVFLMCKLDDSTRFYWEPTLAEEKDVSFYRGWLNIPENSDYPKILGEREFEAIQFCNLGVAWHDKGDYGKAIEYFKSAIRLNPNFAAANNNLGVAFAKQGSFDDAIECYTKAIRMNPNYATAFNNMGVAFYRLGNFQKSVEFFKKAIAADPKYDRAYKYGFIVLMKIGERHKAYKLLNKIRKFNQKASVSPKL